MHVDIGRYLDKRGFIGFWIPGLAVISLKSYQQFMCGTTN